LLALPNAVAGWSNWSYAILAPLLFSLTALILLPGFRRILKRLLFESFSLRFGVLTLLASVLMVGYFARGELSALALLVSHLLVLGGVSHLLTGEARGGRRPGPWLATGLLFFLWLNFFNAFAFTYPYVLPFMRGLGWTVYLVAALALGFAALLHPSPGAAASDQAAVPGEPVTAKRVEMAWALAGGILGLGLFLVVLWPRPAAPLPGDGRLRVATYNIHYGYDAYWHLSLEDIARTIEANGVHVIALQEVDRGRLTSYSLDNAYYLARRLGMQVAYLPTVEHLTGIAVLYAGPAAQVEARLLPSLQEQTGVVRVSLDAGGKSLNAYGIWMGLSDEDTLRQIREALDFIGATSPATFGGDFNAEPDSPVAGEVLRAGFVDPFVALGFDPPPFTSPAIGPVKQIDYVWVRGLAPMEAWVPDSLASDHRMVVVEVQFGP
jgi:endonuclease/exonuclease/phosphatase family metal-dependent hydrolase